MGGHNDGGNDGPPSSPADGDDNNAVVGNNQGDATAADVGRGDADAGTLSIVIVALNITDHDNNAKDNDANAKDATGKKTLMKDAPAAGTGGGASALAVIFSLCNNDIGSSPYDGTLALSIAPCSHDDDEAP